MTTFIFANNINAELAGGISSSETTLTLNSTQNLPTSIPSGSVLALTLCNATATTAPTVFEIVYVTAISGATLTVLRAQEGTAAQVWLTGNAAFSGPTAGQMASFIQGASSGVTPGTYGTSTSVGTFTVSDEGIITEATDTAIAFPITSFNGRAGAVALTTGDISTALGFNPLGAAIAANTLLGNPTGASASPTTITLANGIQFASGALGMGAITPTSVVATGVISGTTGSFSGPMGCVGVNSTSNVNVTSSQPALNLINNASGGDYWIIQSSATGGVGGAGALLFYNNTLAIEMATLSNNGNFTVFPTSSYGLTIQSTSASNQAGLQIIATNGTTAPNKTIRTNGASGNMEWVNSAYSAVICLLSDGGNFTASGVIQPGSDIRVKDQREKIDGALAIVEKYLVGHTYYRKDLQQWGAGYIAQYVKEGLPNLIGITELAGLADFHTVDYNGAQAYIANGLIELRDESRLRMDNQERRIAALESR